MKAAEPLRTAVIYARYSSAQQRDASIEQQVKVCQKYAADNGLTVLRVYDDHAMTGTNDNRPMFQQMIRDSASGAFSFVIVYSLDRFSRDRYDSAIHKHTLKERGVKVLSAVENIQDNPTGVLMESILEGFAEYYSKELAQKVRRGIRSNAEKAMVVAQLPLGYRRGADGKFEIVPEEAEVVREIFRRVADGDQLSEIYTDLNARGIRTKKGHAFGKNSFQGLLHNEKYIGIFRYDDIVLTDAVPPIVDEATFRRVQERYSGASHQYHPQKRVNQNGSYLLTGKLYCGHCKGPMVGTSGTGKHGELHYYYTCRTRQKTKTCKKKPVRRDEIERLIAQRLHQMIFAEDVVDRIADELIAYLKANEITDEVRNLTAQIQALEREEANTLKAIRMGVVAAPVQKMLEQIETDLDTLRARLLLAKERARSDITKDEVLTLFEMFREGDIGSKEYQEKLIDAFLIRAYVYDDRVKIVFNYSAAGSNEVEIPFDIDTVDKTPPGSDKSPEGVLFLPYTNPDNLFFVKGFFVLITDFAGTLQKEV